jgi:hypothetical protein
VTKLYIKWRNGQVELRKYDNQEEAYAVWLALPKGVRAAFRGAGDTRPVFSWDYVDKI